MKFKTVEIEKTGGCSVVWRQVDFATMDNVVIARSKSGCAGWACPGQSDSSCMSCMGCKQQCTGGKDKESPTDNEYAKDLISKRLDLTEHDRVKLSIQRVTRVEYSKLKSAGKELVKGLSKKRKRLAKERRERDELLAGKEKVKKDKEWWGGSEWWWASKVYYLKDPEKSKDRPPNYNNVINRRIIENKRGVMPLPFEDNEILALAKPDENSDRWKMFHQ